MKERTSSVTLGRGYVVEVEGWETGKGKEDAVCEIGRGSGFRDHSA